MKVHSILTLVMGLFLAAETRFVMAQEQSVPFVHETAQEFFATGDFDGDGRVDFVVVDKETGKYRLGYQLTAGMVTWVDCRPSGIKGVTGFTLGKLLVTNHAALAFTSPDANQLSLADASDPNAPGRPLLAPFSAALGPNTLVAVDVGGAGNTRLDDFFVSSIYNSPDPNEATLLRNDRAEFPKLAAAVLPGPAVRGNRVALKVGSQAVVSLLVTGETGDTFRAEDVSGGKAVTVATAGGLPAGMEYAVGNFRGKPLADFVFYKPGESKLLVRSVEEPAPGRFELGSGNALDLGKPVLRVITLGGAPGEKLLVIFGNGEHAGLFSFDGVHAPALVQTIVSTNELLTCAESFPGGFIAFSETSSSKFSTRYLVFKTSGAGYAFSAFGGLPSLADNDNITIPDIRDRIVQGLKVRQESEMRPYTNAIPGTAVTYVMLPIPGGEFLMGSPANEAGRKADEGPQHRVKISPFWMQQCEVTWNEYELFMYPDQEKRERTAAPSDADAEKLADAVTHPSKPYVEMSFGMGKEGFPAIAMTQHGANKYCQWLSAKTGEFYRLPTEAEWEYACRAGTTTSYFFGDEVKQVGAYAWFEQNSDFKYQKVGKKKPNPWGLYDISGNVLEWVLDQYDPDYYKACAARGVVTDPWNRATQPYPLAARGGSWDDEAGWCRSAARRGSARAWKMQDPQLPKSVWYFSDAQFVGFRMVRPLKVPPPEDMQKYWTSGVEKD